MSRRVARALAIGILVFTVVSVTVAAVVDAATHDRIEPGTIVVVGDLDTPGMRQVLDELSARVEDGDALIASGGVNAGFVVLVVVLLAWISVGVLIVWRQPANWAGWLFILIGATFPLLTLMQTLVIYGLKVEPGAVPFIGAWATFGEFALYPIALIPLLFLLYPDGHLPSRRWRWASSALVGGTALAFLGFLFRPGPFNNWRDDGILYENPFGADGFASIGPALITVGAISILAAALATVIAVRQRYRRSVGEERQQMRVLVFVASLAGGFLLLLVLANFVAAAAGFGEGPGDELPVIPILFGLTGLTVAIGIPVAFLVAILRYRLWELDVVIKKTVIFGVVAGGLTLLLLLVVLVVPAAVVGTGLTGWERALLFAGVAVGLLMGPLRRRARRFADRIVYGGRATPYEVLSAFGERVGETYSTEEVLPRMARLLAEATGADTATVWIRVGGDLVAEAGHPSVERGRRLPARGDAIPPIEGEHAAEVRHQGELLGALSVRMPANDPMDPSKEKLVSDLAAQAGLVLRNVRLIEELRASRQRLVAAQDEERRKIERNLHDGAQQQLVALAVRLKLARTMVERDPAKTGDMLDTLQGSASEALENLRDLARGIYPPLLADQGLAAAIEAQARKAAVPTTVDAEGVDRYGQDVEAAVYFCTLEALNNVAKYAEASSARVHLTASNGDLLFEVTDDGRGFDASTTSYGTGIQGMADRLDAIGGELTVRSAPGEGTTVTGRVPVGSGA